MILCCDQMVRCVCNLDHHLRRSAACIESIYNIMLYNMYLEIQEADRGIYIYIYIYIYISVAHSEEQNRIYSQPRTIAIGLLVLQQVLDCALELFDHPPIHLTRKMQPRCRNTLCAPEDATWQHQLLCSINISPCIYGCV